LSTELEVANLGLQLAIVAGFVLLMVLIHSAGLVGISRALRLHDERQIPNEFGVRASILMGTYGLMLMALHFAEIFIFATFYWAVGAMHTLEQSLYYSASCYATLGDAAANFPNEWRLVGALEALIGFVLIGWSTAFMVRTLRKIID
jgi:hypothetical protein